MAVKNTSKKASKKKVSKNKVTKDSSARAFSVNAVFGNDINNDDIPDLIRPGLRAEARGEFRGDFTRDTFNPQDKFSRVLMQQGRVQLDADWNEQNSIIDYRLRNLAINVGGEHWGPHKGAAFSLLKVDDSNVGMLISPGHYYVNGIQCEVGLDKNDEFIQYTKQPYYTLQDNEQPGYLQPIIELGQQVGLVYLDVWERHFNYINDDSIREVALGGPDTATRAKTIWQIKIALISSEILSRKDDPTFKEIAPLSLKLTDAIIKPGKGKLCAKVKDKSNDDNDPCLISPESRYRGAENQLYRVEIHNTGVADTEGENQPTKATYKWSRENSSVIFPITEINGNAISLEHLGKDCRYGLKPNDWVEIVDDDYVLQCKAEPLLRVESIDEENRQITLSGAPMLTVGTSPSNHPYLRRWDHKNDDEKGMPVREDAAGELWLDLEDGIQVQFRGFVEELENNTGGDTSAVYQTGDYWLIPARTITGDIEWPRDIEDKAKCIEPHGVVHHYAPLAIFSKGEDNDNDGYIDLRRILKQAWE